MKQVDLLIVGAGPAGIAAAVTAARGGLSVTLVDESPHQGGQVLVDLEATKQLQREAQAIKRGRDLLQQLHHLPVEIKTQTIVWGIDGHRVALTNSGGSYEIEASAVIIAAGAREFVPPFPGWTLPGVMTLGGAQHLTKWYGVLPGRSILIAGTGPLMWALAATILEYGGNIVAILDASRPLEWISTLPQLYKLRDRISLGLHYLNSIRAQRVPYRFVQRPLRAYGKHVLESVTIGDRTFQVDTLCVGFGFRPNIELFQLANCALRFDPSMGAWFPMTDENMQTDQSGIFAVGECAGVGGVEKALVEGEIAAYSAVSSTGNKLTQDDQRRLQRLRRQRQNELRFARILNRASSPTPAYLRELEDGTILCRCENVCAGSIRRAIQSGNRTLDGLKNELRVGQGICQGRTCGPILQWLFSNDRHASESQPAPFHVRPPVKAISLDQLERRL